MRYVFTPVLLLLLLADPSVRAAEAPAEAPAVQVRFLDDAAARKAIVDDAAEPYFGLLMPMEMAAMTGAPMPEGTLEEQRAECRRRYQAGVLEFTDAEQDALRWYATGMSGLLDKDYPLLARTQWSFAKVADSIEGGTAWTRGDSVFLPARMVRELVQALARGRTKNTLVAGQLLVHEQLHVLQRRHPGIFDDLYIGRWGFLHPDRIEGDAYLDERQILNPDAPDLRWVFPIKDGDRTRYVWPRIIFGDTAGPPQFPSDMRPVAVSVEPAGDGFRVVNDQDGKPVMKELAAVKEYADALKPSTYTIHPNEASADIFCGLLVFDYFIPHSRLPADYVAQAEADLSGYRAYFRAQLKEPAAPVAPAAPAAPVAPAAPEAAPQRSPL